MIRNYLLCCIEYCLYSSSKIGLLNNVEYDLKNDDDDNIKDQQQQPQSSKSIGLITNLSFLETFIDEYLAQYKLIKNARWINSNDIMIIILLRILDLLLAGV